MKITIGIKVLLLIHKFFRCNLCVAIIKKNKLLSLLLAWHRLKYSQEYWQHGGKRKLKHIIISSNEYLRDI